MFSNGPGTRFKLYPQAPYVKDHKEPEVVILSAPAGTIAPGPSDDMMYTIDPAVAKEPYEFPYLPPFRGPVNPPAEPDADGHFDYLPLQSRQFHAAHMFGCLSVVRDIWQSYYGRPLCWQWRDDFSRLELIPLLDWTNAQSGYGYIETGHIFTRQGERRPHCLNFDVLAHEMGHMILFAELGVPPEEARTAHYYGFHEACSDLIALISVLHFESVLDHLLAVCQGNLYAANELNRIGELSDTDQLRSASNAKKFSGTDGPANNPHDSGAPFTGALFDVFVQIFHEALITRGLLPDALVECCYERPMYSIDNTAMQTVFALHYREQADEFKIALRFARDYTGQLLSQTWADLNPHDMHFNDAAEAVCGAELVLSEGQFQEVVQTCLQWRQLLR